MTDKQIAAAALGVREDEVQALYNFGTHLIVMLRSGGTRRVDLPFEPAVEEPADAADSGAAAEAAADPFEGLPPAVVAALQERFSSPAAIAAASDEDLLALPKVGPKMLKAIRAAFGGSSTDDAGA